MSVHDVRRGPGWWMDLEGGWNPPDTWPEPSPPLPGWIRTADGRWEPPETGANEDEDVGERNRTRVAPAPERPGVAEDSVDRPRLGLTYADRPAAAPVVHPYAGPSVRSAMLAAFAAAVIAAMIATGMIMLVSLL